MIWCFNASFRKVKQIIFCRRYMSDDTSTNAILMGSWCYTHTVALLFNFMWCIFECILPSVLWHCWLGGRKGIQLVNKKLSYRRVTARCVLSVETLPITTQQCRNYLYGKSWPNWWYEVGGLVGGYVSWTMCTQPWCDRVGSHCLRYHKQTDDGRIVYITSIPMTCCGEIF